MAVSCAGRTGLDQSQQHPVSGCSHASARLRAGELGSRMRCSSPATTRGCIGLAHPEHCEQLTFVRSPAI